MEEIKKVLVFGSTGMIGKPVTHELIDAGFEVTCFARNSQKVNAEFGINRIFKGDLQTSEVLENAMKGQDAIYISLSVSRTEKRKDYHPENDGLKKILAAAQKSGIKRIVYLSSLVMRYNNTGDFNWWVFELKQEAVKHIKASGIPYTIFYPSNFMESLSNLYKSGNKLLLAGESKEKMFFIAGKDYGKTVVAALRNPAAANQDYSVQGTEAYKADEAVKIFQENYTKEKLKISKAPLGMLKFLGHFSNNMSYAFHIIQALNNYPEKFESENTWKQLHKPEITLKDFIKSL